MGCVAWGVGCFLFGVPTWFVGTWLGFDKPGVLFLMMSVDCAWAGALGFPGYIAYPLAGVLLLLAFIWATTLGGAILTLIYATTCIGIIVGFLLSVGKFLK